ncbi:hypothetical protein L1987_74303 [Smallanthus sonchifolius]|uniref:Uncharacterized protein n=1 Tax=Smallanthus sonchifolius TaxID=185202 RepID=A0ACB9A2D2_9ASTR|nr:hypothetical protein L1987_74303 [Smallanthus sonchifolius]
MEAATAQGGGYEGGTRGDSGDPVGVWTAADVTGGGLRRREAGRTWVLGHGDGGSTVIVGVAWPWCGDTMAKDVSGDALQRCSR